MTSDRGVPQTEDAGASGTDPSKTEKARAAAGAGLVSTSTIVAGILNVLLVTCLTRFVDKSTFALLAMVQLVSETVHAIGGLGLPAALAYFVPKAGEAHARALGFWTGMLLFGISIPISAAVYFAGPLFAVTPAFHAILGLFCVYLVADFPGMALPAWLLARRSYRGHFIATIAFAASRFASLAIPAALGAEVHTLLACFTGVAGLRFLAFLAFFLFGQRGRGSLSPVSFKPARVLGYGVPISLSLLVGKLNVQVDRYVIAAIAGAEAFAVYTVGAVEIPLVHTLAYTVTGALIPTLVLAFERRDLGAFTDLWHGAVVKVAAVMMPLFCYFAVLAEPAMRVLFSREYEAAAIPFRVYLLLLPLRLCSYGGIVRALGDTRSIVGSSLLALAVNALAIYPLYSLFGVAGPATAAVLGQLAAVVWLLSHIRAKTEVRWGAVFPWRRVGVAFGAAALAALPLVGVSMLPIHDAWKLVLGAVVYLAAYLASGLRLGSLLPADFRYLGDLVLLRGLRR